MDELYSEGWPEQIAEGLRQAIEFLNGGKSGEEGEGVRVFSLSKDANLIFSAFHQTHHLDLEGVGYLHWWKWLALLMDLGSETAFCQLISLRRRVKLGKATKEERAAAIEMGAAFEVPEYDTRTLEEKLAARRFYELAGVNK